MKIVIPLILILLSSISYADQKAVTDTGDEVILYNNGTWEYINKTKHEKNIITTNATEFTKPKNSTFLLKSTKNNSAYWINTNSWSFTKAENNEAAEYQFQLKGKDLWGISISEGVSIPIESLADIALQNAKAAAPDAKIIKQEFRMVNGLKVLYMEMKGTLQGIKFMYLGYYYSDNSGSTQYLTYTASNLVGKYESEIYDFLNGFTVQ